MKASPTGAEDFVAFFIGRVYMSKVSEKLNKLKLILREMGGVVIGYSGGVDSTFLAVVAKEELGDNALCVLASSPMYPVSEVEEAIDTAGKFGLKLIKIETDELNNEDFARNTPDRCFYCKTELFKKLKSIADENKIDWVADGENVDDLDDYRPGRRAAANLGVRSPLKEAGFTKDDIRAVSHEMGLPTWNKPSFACLSSRIPYGARIEPGVLWTLDKAEQVMKGLGFRQYRVRHHGNIARIEVTPEDIVRASTPEVRDIIVNEFKKLGYLYVTLDLSGYKTGSMNAVLKDIGGSENGR